jgi:hypothetical protein
MADKLQVFFVLEQLDQQAMLLKTACRCLAQGSDDEVILTFFCDGRPCQFDL